MGLFFLRYNIRKLLNIRLLHSLGFFKWLPACPNSFVAIIISCCSEVTLIYIKKIEQLKLWLWHGYYLLEIMLDLEGFGYGGANPLTQLQTLGQ